MRSLGFCFRPFACSVRKILEIINTGKFYEERLFLARSRVREIGQVLCRSLGDERGAQEQFNGSERRQNKVLVRLCVAVSVDHLAE